jgi:hypothetical protein
MDFFLNSLGSMVGLIEMKYALGWLRYILEIVRHEAARKMRVGPSGSACRSRLQTTLSCCGKEPWW